MLNELVKYQKDWLSIAYSFVQNKQDAEDIIQDMYILLDKYNVKLERIRYKDGINKFFMYTTIKNMCLQFFKKQKYHLDLDDIQIEVEEDEEQKVAFNKLISKVDSIVAQWNYYDRTVFEMYMYSGLSYRDIAYGTKKKAKLISNRKWLGDEAVKRGNKISVSSMFNTIKQCRIKLQEELGEDFEDYFNNDFDKI